MSCVNWNSPHDTKLLNMYNFSSTNDLFNKPVLQGTFGGYSGSSVIPSAKSVSIGGSTDCNVNINALTTPAVSSSTCAKSNWAPIVSDCNSFLNIYSGYGCCGGWGFGGWSWGMPAEYYTRVGQAYDKTDALRIYNDTSWSTIIKGSLKNNLIDMMSTPSGTVQTFSLAAQGFKGVCGVLGSLWNGIAG